MSQNSTLSFHPHPENGMSEHARPEEKFRCETHPRTKQQIMQTRQSLTQIRSVVLIQKHVRIWLKHKAEKQNGSRATLARASTEQLQEKLEAWEAAVAKSVRSRKEYWTQSQKMTLSIGLVVLINAITLGIEADFGTQYPLVFFVLENVFTSIFALEVVAHFLVEGPRIYFSDKMNWLDFCLVSFAALDVWILQLANVDADLKLMSIFRMLRLVRLGRLLRLFRVFKELTLILTGFLASVRTLFWALIFLLILVYIFSIFARQIIGMSMTCANAEEDDLQCDANDPGAESFYKFNPEIGDQQSLFGGVDRTMLTLFVCLTDGCGIDIVHPTVLATPWLFAFWIVFVMGTTFGLLNLIVGIFCENAMKTAAENDKAILKSRERQRRHTLQALKRGFQEMDTDGSGSITKEEFFEAILENDTVMNAMEELGLHQEENLFETLDADKSGVITFDQFFDGAMLIMKGHESAKAKDMVGVHLLCQSLARRCSKMQKLYEVVKSERDNTDHTLMLLQAQNHDNIKAANQISDKITTLAGEISIIKEAIVP